jgi:colanic acid biosynthesis glycosyl transferase WcaI
MKVFIHTMYYLPDFGSAPILMAELASHLAGRGHEVEVVTTVPRTRTRDLAGRFISRRRENGFGVTRFWTNASPRSLGRLLAWNIYTAASLLNMASFRPGDVLMLRTPPLQLGFVGCLAKRLKGVRVLLNVQDIHPDLSIESGILKNPVGIRFAKALEKWAYGISDRILVISRGFEANLLEKGVPASKMAVVPNWVDTDFLRPLPKDNAVSRRHGLHDRFVLMYSGTVSISSNRALEGVLESARLLAGEEDVRFVVVGEGLKKAALRKRAEELGLSNVLFLPFQDYADLPELLASADVLLVPLDRDKSRLSVPSKLYNFMAAGRPILGVATPDSEVAAIVRDNGCGFVVPPGDPSGLAATVMALKSAPDRLASAALRARTHVESHFSKDKILRKYEDLLLSMTSNERGPLR